MTTTRKLSGRTRKTVLLVHILTAAAWFGIDLALGILVVVSLVADDPRTAGTAIQAVDLFAIWPMFGTSVVCLVSGVVLGIGSKYGLVRYRWVAVKLVINVVMSALIFFALRPGIGDAASIGERMVAGDPAAAVPGDLLYPVVVAPTLLVIAYLLSVFKPWGKVRRSPRGATPPAQRVRTLTGAR
ncbi:hypothetical protein FKR81_00470 [Lentzea tibetensis]|uniref:DUF2269 domain-containing protein n=1 Tax=Lentzea tibetensis TaxID=2591470 RepID=A0A563F290_9PSEU|nr:hypothetical protein [Lentzea tibetensis]TWP54080.1 hypothetical protein FKR81_00470 [Lentzea tibetensis]